MICISSYTDATYFDASWTLTNQVVNRLLTYKTTSKYAFRTLKDRIVTLKYVLSIGFRCSHPGGGSQLSSLYICYQESASGLLGAQICCQLRSVLSVASTPHYGKVTSSSDRTTNLLPPYHFPLLSHDPRVATPRIHASGVPVSYPRIQRIQRPRGIADRG